MIDKAKPEASDPDLNAPGATDAEQAINESPGRLIRQARERVQMSLDELAAQTKLPRSVLDALERDDFKTLRESVYVRGYYRKCCGSLKLSEETLIAAYQRMVGLTNPKSPSKMLLVPDNEVFGSQGTGSMRWWVALIVVIAVLAAAYYYLHNRTNLTAVPPVPVLPSPATQGTHAPSPAGGGAATTAGNGGAVAVTAAPAPAPASTPSSSSSTAAALVAKPVVPSAPQTTSPAAVAGPSAAVAWSSLILDFSKTSWVRIEDRTGKVLLTGVIPAGDKQVLAGKPPYSVFLGNAPGVTVKYDGKTIDLQPFIKSNSTARFSVPQG